MISSPLPLEHKGRTHYVHSLTDEMRGAYSSWMKAEAIKNTLALRSMLPPADFRHVLSELNSDISVAKKYEFGGEKFMEMVQSEAGATEFVRLVLVDPTLTDKDIQELLTEAGDKYQELFKLANPSGEVDECEVPKA